MSHAVAVIMLAVLLPSSAPTADATKRVAAAAKQYGDSERGKEIAARWCISCHSSGPTSDDRIPTLQALATRLSRTEDQIRGFLMHPHEPMPPLELGTQQIEDIITYLRSIEAGAGTR